MQSLDYRFLNNQPPIVFMSATSKGLRGARESARDFAASLGLSPIEQANFNYYSESPLQQSMYGVGRCDIFLGIIGLNFGTVEGVPDDKAVQPFPDHMSITQLEFQKALELKKVMYIHVPRDLQVPHDLQSLRENSVSFNHGLYMPFEVEEESRLANQRQFIQYVKQQNTRYFYQEYSTLAELWQHITANINLVSTGRDTPEIAKRRGESDLGMGNFQGAYMNFQLAIQYIPSDTQHFSDMAKLHFFLALALLSGRAPRGLVDMGERDGIEALLARANNFAKNSREGDNRVFLAFWAAFQLEAYPTRRMQETAREKLRQAKNCPPQPELLNFISRIYPEIFRDYLTDL